LETFLKHEGLTVETTELWKKGDFHRWLVNQVFTSDLGEDETLALISVLYRCSIKLRPSVTEGHPESRLFPPISATHGAEVVSSLWKGSRDPRNSARYWRNKWINEWDGYRRIGYLSNEEVAVAKDIIRRLEGHILIEKLVLEDPNQFLLPPGN
jgi:hypothetical protein